MGGRVLSTLYLDRPRGASDRRAPSAPATTSTRSGRPASTCASSVYAPFGDDPLLLHDVTIRNRTRTPKRASWFEYWDVNPYLEGA